MSIRVLAATVLITAASIQTLSAQDWEPRGWRREGVQIRIGRNYHLPADQIASWPIVVVGATATIDGRVEDELVVIGGALRIGPTAQIRGEVTTIGARVQVAREAELAGGIRDVGFFWPDIEFAWRELWWGVDQAWWALFGIMATVARVVLTMCAACVIALLAPNWIRRIGGRAADAPLASGAIGLLTQILFIPLVIIVVLALLISLVGIPLLALVPFALFAFAVFWLAGFAGVAARVGGGLRRALGARFDAPVLDTAVGVLLMGALTIPGQMLAAGPGFLAPASAASVAVGLFIEYLAWTVGLGAALTAPVRDRWGAAPPPVPASAAF